MKVKDVMCTTPTILTPEASIVEAAQNMQKLDCGFLPVGENDRLIGTVTDRDIVLRAVAGKKPLETKVRDVMSNKIRYCFEDQDTDEALKLMQDQQIRRLAVLNRNKRLTGIVSLGDLAKKCSSQESGTTLKEISKDVAAVKKAA